MGDVVVIAIVAAVALAIGTFIGRILLKSTIAKYEKEAKDKASLIVKEAEINGETIKKDKILEAKERFLKLKSEFEEEAGRKKNQIINNEQKLKQREKNLSKQIEKSNRKREELERIQGELNEQLDVVGIRLQLLLKTIRVFLGS